MNERLFSEAVKTQLHDGYTHFQLWLQKTLSQLPSEKILEPLTRQNSFPSNAENDIEDLQPRYLKVGTIPDPQNTQTYINFSENPLIFYLTPSYLTYENIYRFLIDPVSTLRVPLNYPYLRIEWDTNTERSILLALRLRHQGKKGPLLQTQLDFDTENKTVTKIIQVVKDNTFFTNPVPKQEKKRKEQVFYFYSESSGEMGYVFKYRAKRHLSDHFHCPFSRGGPFPPYQGYLEFNLPEALEKVFRFEPVVDKDSVTPGFQKFNI